MGFRLYSAFYPFLKGGESMEDYFVGHKIHKIDNKGRISIPANMRAGLGQEFIASRGFGKCIALFPLEEWNAFLQRIHDDVSQSDRKQLEFFFLANAEKLSLDGQGRLLLNENLRRQAALIDEDKAEVFGNNRRIEIWNSELFAQQLNAINEADVESILDKYGI
ncbi:MAG: cell division/cell wall cluster transcriptional repressor MraZ [Ruminococcaceae bacterium]|nr:cell division/cell wall cluster transcriptional repressor MraZ [Oscillospiraceae bacterium]